MEVTVVESPDGRLRVSIGGRLDVERRQSTFVASLVRALVATAPRAAGPNAVLAMAPAVRRARG